MFDDVNSGRAVNLRVHVDVMRGEVEGDKEHKHQREIWVGARQESKEASGCASVMIECQQGEGSQS